MSNHLNNAIILLKGTNDVITNGKRAFVVS